MKNAYNRVVVKIGTSVISREDGKLDGSVLARLVGQIARLRKEGKEVIVVTSGAVGTGRGQITLTNSADNVVKKQIYAAVGQVKLMGMYAAAFAKRGVTCAQVLATKEDFRDREHYLHMGNCIEGLLKHGVVPVVNENDVVAVSELVFTDNDELAGLIASQARADAVIMLTSVDGVYEGDPKHRRSRVIPEIRFADRASFKKHVTGDTSSFGRGGMRTKFTIAEKLAEQGITTFVGNGRRHDVIPGLLAGTVVGTKFLPRARRPVSSMRTIQRIFKLAVLASLFLIPLPAAAATSKSFEVSGWIPYWRTATGTADALQHLDVFTEINPFVYTLKSDGTLVDNGKLGAEPWASFIAEAKRRGVRVIPSVMNSNGEFIAGILKNSSKRQALEDRIAALVFDNNFDGIDIDFEAKGASTNGYFSLFLKGLQMRLGSKKWLMCTIEARTPPQDAYAKPPKKLEYANDFAAINKYCDRVRFMTYDQQTADLTLNKKNKAIVYTPIADTAWVEKAITLAAKQISKKKIVIGIATYGYEYRVGGAVGDYTYSILWSFNPRYADQIAAAYGVTPARSAWGEMGLAYVPTSTQMMIGADVMSAAPVPGEIASAADPPDATSTSRLQTAFQYLVWSDAKAVADKVALAKKLGVRGVAIFKIDGGQDPAIWDVLR